jgi:hypothetical protein
MRIAIMQPYFLPYAGYFRLIAGADAFVVLDTAQFPRRGWVHRNRLRRDDGELAWLTLPLAYAPRDSRIGDMSFHPEADELWGPRLRAFPACRAPRPETASLLARLRRMESDPVSYLLDLMACVNGLLGFTTPMLRASALRIPPEPDRAQTLVAIGGALGATAYLNAPGGRELYDPEEFMRAGIELRFLPEYRGNFASILQRLHDEPADAIRREILENLEP